MIWRPQTDPALGQRWFMSGEGCQSAFDMILLNTEFNLIVIAQGP